MSLDAPALDAPALDAPSLADLPEAERRFIDQLAELNGLSAEQALHALLHPQLRKAAGGWRPGVTFEDGRLVELRMGAQSGGSYPTLLRVPSVDLPALRSAVIVGGCHLLPEAHVRGAALTELEVHGQPELQALTVGGGLRALSVMGNPKLRRLTLYDAPALGALDIFELPALNHGVGCWDIQLDSVEGLRRLQKKRVAEAALRTATPEILRAVAEASMGSEAWASRLAKGVLDHPSCPQDVALWAWWQAAQAVFPHRSSLSQCETPEEKGLFKAATQAEKRAWESWAPADLAPLDEHVDVAGWARAPFPALAERLGLRLSGAPVKRASKPKVQHPSDAEALRRFGDWLAHPMELGRPAEALELVYRKVIPWSINQKTKIFLVRWRMHTGEAFVGVTGPFTWSFLGLAPERLEALRPDTRWRRLVNLYVGWWLCFLAAQREDHAARQAASLDAAGLEAAFPRDLAKVEVNLHRRLAFEGAEHLGDVSTTSVRGRHVTLRCLAPPEVFVEPEGRRHYAVAAELTFRYKGQVVKNHSRLFLHGDGAGRLEPHVRQLPLDGHGVIDDLPLFHWVGSQLGPFAFSTSVGGLSLFDH
ncbi:MAG: hypothetical protein H6741_30160 [Alphaproteobacteria bacterium]|nr:hypothetical protein [Alphaproteobacteria bacterium]